MIINVEDVLSADHLSTVSTLLPSVRFEPGEKTAGWHARQVKANQQATDSASTRAIIKLVTRALSGHPIFQQAVLPARLSQPLLARYDAGASYGAHVDNAYVGDPPLRADVSVSLFLSDPDTYEGGELVLQTHAGEEAWKLPAGSALLYPSTYLHRVAPVTSGTRYAMVLWVQSRVRSAEHRDSLFEIDQVRRALFDDQGKSEGFDKLSRVHANLLRLWGDG